MRTCSWTSVVCSRCQSDVWKPHAILLRALPRHATVAPAAWEIQTLEQSLAQHRSHSSTAMRSTVLKQHSGRVCMRQAVWMQVAQRVECELAERSELSRMQGKLQDAEARISKLQADLDYTRRVRPFAALCVAMPHENDVFGVIPGLCQPRIHADRLLAIPQKFVSKSFWRHFKLHNSG